MSMKSSVLSHNIVGNRWNFHITYTEYIWPCCDDACEIPCGLHQLERSYCPLFALISINFVHSYHNIVTNGWNPMKLIVTISGNSMLIKVYHNGFRYTGVIALWLSKFQWMGPLIQCTSNCMKLKWICTWSFIRMSLDIQELLPLA